jgi:uncharacterized protein involved in exopolysaccharide biosynthesis
MTHFERVGNGETSSGLTELTPTVSGARAPRDDGVSAAWVLAILLRNRFVVAGVTVLAVLVTLVVVMLRPPEYAVSLSFVPQTTQAQSNAGIAALAGQFGLAVGGLSGASQPPQFYADLLETRELLEPIARDGVSPRGAGARRMLLSEFLGRAGGDTAVVAERTIDRLRERVVSTSVATRTTGVVSVVVRTTSPTVSFEIAQRLLDGLNQFNRVTRQSQAGAERRFVEGRLEAARVSLRSAEDALQTFLQGNREFSNSPQLMFTQQRLQREVLLQQQVVTGLAQQYEEARIREVRDTPVITMIDQPRVPARPASRHLVRAVTVSAFIGLTLAMALVIGRAGWQRRRQVELGDPGYALLDAELDRLRSWARRS